jgi:hypothetical protein
MLSVLVFPLLATTLAGGGRAETARSQPVEDAAEY